MESECHPVPQLGMNNKHRDIIWKSIDNLIDETDYKALKNACLERRILSRMMINKIEAVSDRLDDDALLRECHKRLFQKLTKRGPDAFEALKQIFLDLGYHKALLYLDENSNDDNHISMLNGRQNIQPNNNNTNKIISDGCKLFKSPKVTDDFLELRQYTGEISPQNKFEVIKSTQIHDDGNFQVYPMKSQHDRGVLFMVNIINFKDKKDFRNGADNDGESLLYLFKELGFKLYEYKDITTTQFFSLLHRLLKSEEVKRTECFVMALMTHGNMDQNNVERVEFTDGSIVKVDEILQYFSNEECVNLTKKPKIFIFPFCRGMQNDYGHHLLTQTDGVATERTRNIVPSIADIMICYATLRGFKSHRDVEDGSWYIQSFCEHMAKYAHYQSFDRIIKMTQDATNLRQSNNGTVQTGNYYSIGFNKELYFNPGAYENSSNEHEQKT